MLPVDFPTTADIRALAAVRGFPCVSITVETTPITQHTDASRIALANAAREAQAQLEAAGTDKRLVAATLAPFADLADDEDFWAHQARSLAVFATPGTFQTFRLANRLTHRVEVSDRFHLQPLLRAVTFPHTGFVLALSESSARLVEFFADLPPEEVAIPDLPRDAASHAGKASINDRSASGRIQGSEGKKVRLGQYARAVAAALRPVLAGGAAPLILACNEPLAAIFRQHCAYPGLAKTGIGESIDRLPLADLAAAARPILDAGYAEEVAGFRALYATRGTQRRVTAELSTAARAATFGAVEALMVDIDAHLPGTIDDDTGAVTLADGSSAASYEIVDQLAQRTLLAGGTVIAARQADLPEAAPFAAVLRYPM